MENKQMLQRTYSELWNDYMLSMFEIQEKYYREVEEIEKEKEGRQIIVCLIFLSILFVICYVAISHDEGNYFKWMVDELFNG